MKVLIFKEFRSNWRSFRYPAFLLVILFFALLDPPMIAHMDEIIGYFAAGMELNFPDPTPADAFASYLSDASQIGLMVLIFVLMGSVAKEKETGVAGWMLSKPVSRWQFLGAKYLVHCLVIILGILACSALAYLYTMSLLGTIPIDQAALGALALISFALLITSITFFFSTVLKSPLQAGGAAIVIFFISGILNMLVANSAAADFYPNTLLANILPLINGTAGLPDILGPLAVTLALSLLLFVLSGLIFRKIEL